MGGQMLIKEFFITIKKTFNRFISILIIMMLGVAFFSGLRATKPDMRLTGDQYYDDFLLSDITVQGTLGLTEADRLALSKITGVKTAEGVYTFDAYCESDGQKKVLRLYSLSLQTNLYQVTEGRQPAAVNECLMDQRFMEANGLSIGDTVSLSSGDQDVGESLSTDQLRITGACTSPMFMSSGRGISSIGDGSVSGFAVVLPECFKAEYFTSIHILVDGAKELSAYTEAYDNHVSVVQERVEAIAGELESRRLEEVRSQAQKEIDEAKSEIQNAQKKLSDAKGKIDQGQSEIDDAYAELEKQESQLDETEQTLAASKEQLDVGWNMLAAGERELEVQKQQAEVLRAALGDNDPSVIRAQQAIVQAETLLTDQKENLKKGKTQYESGVAALEAGRAQIAEARNVLAEKQSQLDKASQEYHDQYDEAMEQIHLAEADIADGEKEIAGLSSKLYVSDRSGIESYSSYGEDLDRIGNIAQVFPVIFFVVAAFVSLTTMTRMVEEERTQIGTLKALGYGKFTIMMKFILYGFLAAIIGSLIGLYVGQKFFPWLIINVYGMLYTGLTHIVLPINAAYSIASTAIAVFCVTIATVLVCYKVLSASPAELMRPAAPKSGRRVMLERVPFIWNRLRFTQKSAVRNLFRYKKRLFMMLFGIAASMALLVMGFGLKTSIMKIAELQFTDIQKYDCMIAVDPENEEYDQLLSQLSGNSDVTDMLSVRMTAMDIRSGEESVEAYVTVPQFPEKMGEYMTLRNPKNGPAISLADDGVIITEKLSKLLGVSVGDTISFSYEGKESSAVVSDISENYIYHYVYMTPDAYEKTFGAAADYNTLLLNQTDRDSSLEKALGEMIMKNQSVLRVSFTSAVSENINDIFSSLNLVVYVLIATSGILSFVVLYNLNNININERKRELATIKLLGFYDLELSEYVYRENIILTVIGIVLGCFFGKWLHGFVIKTCEVDIMMFGRQVGFTSFLFSIACIVVFTFIVNFIMHFKLKKIDMVESLKSVE